MDVQAWLNSNGIESSPEQLKDLEALSKRLSEEQMLQHLQGLLEQGVLTRTQSPIAQATPPDKRPTATGQPQDPGAADPGQLDPTQDQVYAQDPATQESIESQRAAQAAFQPQQAAAPAGGQGVPGTPPISTQAVAPQGTKSTSDIGDTSTQQNEADYKAITGRDATADFQQYVNSLSDSGMGPGARGRVNYEQWLRRQAQIAMGPTYDAIRNLQAYYQNTYGSPMPSDLVTQVRDFFKKNPDQARIASQMALSQSIAVAQQSLQAGGRGAPGPEEQFSMAGGSIIQSIPGLKFVDEAGASHPTAASAKAKVESARVNQYLAATGRMPDQNSADWKSGMGMSDDQFLTWLYTQNVNGTNLNYGQYYSAQGTASSLWSKYFGTSQPTQADIQHIAGFKDATQAEDWVQSLPSHLPGLSVGDYNGLHSTAESISNKLWNLPAGPDIMSHIHSSIQGK